MRLAVETAQDFVQLVDQLFDGLVMLGDGLLQNLDSLDRGEQFVYGPFRHVSGKARQQAIRVRRQGFGFHP